MSDLIPAIKWEELKAKSPAHIKNLPCQEILDSEGNYIATLVVPSTGFIRVQTEYHGQLSNSIMPKREPEPEVKANKCPECGKVCLSPLGLSGHMRSHKKLVEVT